MRIDVVTLFPDMVTHAASYGVTGRAQDRGLWRLGVVNPRDFAADAHRTVDDRPYGGGPGMVLMAEPLSRALRAAREAQAAAGVAAPRTVHLSPAGAPLTHAAVMDFACSGGFIAGSGCGSGRCDGADDGRSVSASTSSSIPLSPLRNSTMPLPRLRPTSGSRRPKISRPRPAMISHSIGPILGKMRPSVLMIAL